MKKPPTAWHKTLSGLLVLLFVVGVQFVFAAPGGIGGTGSPQGGIGGTGIVGIGFIQGFGSIFVNGTEYQLDPQTQYLIDGTAANATQLHTGDGVLVAARIIDGKPYAQRVEIEHAVIGVVDQMDPKTLSLSVLGQSIVLAEGGQVQSAQGRLEPLTDLHPGDVVSVSAFAISNKRWVAYGIRQLIAHEDSRANQPVAVVLRGSVERIDTAQQTALISGIAMKLPAATLSELRIGASIRLTGTESDGQARFTQAQPIVALSELATASQISAVGLVSADGLQLSTPIGTISLSSALLQMPAQTVLIQATTTSASLLGVHDVRSQINPMTVNISMPVNVQTPSIQTPLIQAPTIQTPSIQVPTIQMPSIQVPAIQAPSIPVPSVQMPAIQTPIMPRM